MCLAHDPGGAFIAETSGQPLGMLTTTRYRHSAWIGNLIVVPEYRRRGIGAQLMRRAMDDLTCQAIRTIRLEADPPGIRLYRRLGFVDEFESPRFARAAGAGLRVEDRGAAPLVERVSLGDLPAIAAFDAQHFGDDRRRLLELLFPQARCAVWCRGESGVAGYLLALPAGAGLRIGPWVASNRATAMSLLRAVLGQHAGTPIILGVPAPDNAALEILAAVGFQRRPACLRMRYGEPLASGHPGHIYAIANGAMG
jgi:ribosomal protein S18 acetylase RimI-like enzyme